ncbi:LysR substrate-binding domain-containing protein [Rhodanobacter sp. BL-MT-08]
MDLRHLRYFVAVAEEGHFGRAAKRLHIVQPALSMQIRALENEIGGALFVRTSRRVELTEAGTLFLVEAHRTIEQSERAKMIAQRSLRGEIGTVRIGFAGIAVPTGKLMGDVREFHQRYPTAELELREVTPQLQAKAILDGDMDIGYCPSVDFTFNRELTAEPIGNWSMVVALASDHRLASKVRLSANDLRSEPVVLYAAEEDKNGPLAKLRDWIGGEPARIYRVPNTVTVLAMAAAGLGLAIVPTPIEQVAIPNITYRRLIGSTMRADLFLISRTRETNGAVRAFLELSRRNHFHSTKRSAKQKPSSSRRLLMPTESDG